MREENSRMVYSTDGPFSEKAGGKKQGNRGGKGKENKAPGGSGPLSGQKKEKLHLRLERKGRGGKTVTLVCGLNSMAGPGEKPLSSVGTMELLLMELKARLGAGGALKGDTLELQGDHRDAVAAILRGKGLNI